MKNYKFMKINFGNWVFSPRLVTSIFTVIFFILFLHLGFWQLDRAEQKRELHSFFNERQSKEAINLNNNFITDAGNFLWRKVSATGNFLERHQILLDNQVNAGQAGYYIYTPFKLKNSEGIFLVNRGWVPIAGDRYTSPNLILLVYFFSSMTQIDIARIIIPRPELNSTYELVQMCLFIGKI